MSDPFVGEIRMFGGNFAPAGWAFCDGQIVAISQNDTLFQLIGTTYGGDGQDTFALPDLQGRVPLHQGQGPGITQNYIIGETGGSESITLTTNQIPIHQHSVLASTTLGTELNPSNALLAQSRGYDLYLENVTSGNMAANAIDVQGGSQPHDNMQPFLCITFIISLFGIFPSP